MRALVPEFIALLALIVIAGLCLVVVGLTTQHVRSSVPVDRWQQWRSASAARKMRAVPWTYYSRPDPVTGDYLVGIERVWRGQVIRRIELAHVSHADLDTRLNWEATAILRAQECNDTRSGMDDPGEN